MRSVVSYALIAIVGGMVGAAVIKSDDLYQRIAGHFSAEPADPDGFWSTPAVAGYGKIHYEADAAFKPAVGLSNKVVFQLTRNEGDIKRPNLALIGALNKLGVKVSVCDQSVAFHHYPRDWIDRSVIHALSSPTTVSTLENQGYAFLQM